MINKNIVCSGTNNLWEVTLRLTNWLCWRGIEGIPQSFWVPTLLSFPITSNCLERRNGVISSNDCCDEFYSWFSMIFFCLITLYFPFGINLYSIILFMSIIHKILCMSSKLFICFWVSFDNFNFFQDKVSLYSPKCHKNNSL